MTAAVIGSIFPLVLQAGLLVAAIWLAIETKRLRTATVDRLEETKRQRRMDLMPRYTISARYAAADTATARWKCRIANIGQYIGYNVTLILYDAREKHFLSRTRLVAYMQPGEPAEDYSFDAGPFNQAGIVSFLEGKRAPGKVLAEVKKFGESSVKDESCAILCLSTDIEGNRSSSNTTFDLGGDNAISVRTSPSRGFPL